MKSRTSNALLRLFCLLPACAANAQIITEVFLTKGSSWVQTSTADPVPNPRSQGPGYGGPFYFDAEVSGQNLSGITAPAVTLASGSLYPTQNSFRHNGGVLTYNAGDDDWSYGVDGGGWGGLTELERDASFAFGTYGLQVLGESFNLNFPNTVFRENTPKVTLTGGTWSGGKYLLDVTKTLTITTNAFTHFDKNADAGLYIHTLNDPLDLIDVLSLRSVNSASPNFLTITVPPNTLQPGRDYPMIASFYAFTDKRGSLASRLDAAFYERSTFFTISAIKADQPGALAKLHGIGDLDGGFSFSEVRDATKVGGVLYAVGDSNAHGLATGADTALLWTSTNGLLPLPDIVTNFSGSSFSSTSAIDLTPNGAYIASRARATTAATSRHAVRVTSAGLTNLDLGTLAGFTNSQAHTVSDDGSVLYGVANYTSAAAVPVRTRAVRFTAGSTTPFVIPFLNAGDDNSAPADRAASADGSVMVGRSTNGTVDASAASPGGNGIGLGNQAFRYVHGAGVSPIPFLPGGNWNAAVAVTPDGNLSVVRGNSASAPQGEFYLHNAATGALTSLGTPNGSLLPGGIVGITADGTILAGPFGLVANAANQTMLRNSHGYHDFQRMVERAGVDLTGWDLRTQGMFGISPDGTLVWGRGTHNGNLEGFIVEFAPGYVAAYTEPTVFSTPHAAIVGAWTAGVGAPSTTLNLGMLIFFSDGYYIHIQTKDVGETNTADGFERGQYTWDAASGALTINTLLDTNGDLGLSGASNAAGVTINISGDAGTLNLPGNATIPMTRVTGNSPIVGAFGTANVHNQSAAVVFLPNGYYAMAQDGNSDPISGDPNGRDGIEWGTYSWSAITGAFSATPLVDTNGQWGLSHLQGASSATLSNALLTLTLSDASGPKTATRVGVASTVASVAAGTNRVVTVGSTTESVTLTFPTVSAGQVTVNTTTSGPIRPTGFIASTGVGPNVFYDISTTATFSGLVEVAIRYVPNRFVDIAGLRLFHFEAGAWIDITSRHDVATNTIYGLTSSLSPFAIFEPSLMVNFNGPQPGTTVPINTNITLSASAEGHIAGRTYNVIWRLLRSGAPELTFQHTATTADLSRVVQVPVAGVYSITASISSNDGLLANAKLVRPNLVPASLVVTDLAPINVTGQLRVTAGGFRLNRTTQRYVQTITIVHTGSQPITGPVSLVFDQLSPNATLFAPAGTTATVAPIGSKFVNLNLGPDALLTPGETVTVNVEFANPSNQSIAYTPRVLAGPGVR